MQLNTILTVQKSKAETRVTCFLAGALQPPPPGDVCGGHNRRDVTVSNGQRPAMPGAGLHKPGSTRPHAHSAAAEELCRAMESTSGHSTGMLA